MSKAKKLKTYVIMVSRVFPCTHPRAGIITGFIPKYETGEKQHTIRANFKLWQKRIKEVNAGRAVLSLRFWIGRPFRSKQQEFARLTAAGIQKIEIYNTPSAYCIIDDLPTPEMTTDGRRLLDLIAENDGLNFSDFIRWFFPRRQRPAELEIFSGAIIRFDTVFKY